MRAAPIPRQCVIATARTTVATHTLVEGIDSRASAPANAEHHRRNREWARENTREERDRAWFLREIMPRLHAFSLNEIAQAVGLSLAAC